MEIFTTPAKTYKTRQNAVKVIESLVAGDFHWLIATTEAGRFFPVVKLSPTEGNFHYYIAKGCCVI